ncbi:Leukotriene A-4 hydrolase-like protein [Zea mays]|uniref:Leukotriene A-4 hydrolase-like protein n=1 Tax=Zea mays TaxID=4577 RepID=A0A1D6HP76_MAIZE|nr:Leukotriene A-4 hydrolase-like protein [Zea mays]
MGIGWRGLNRMMERFKDNMEFTKLKPKMAGIDPDDVYSEVPYEKGFQFLWRIEREIGRPTFDEFLKKYIATFKFQSIDTETFLEFLKTNVPGIENKIDLHLWVEGTGIPPDAMEPDSATYKKICSLAAEFKSGKLPSEYEVAKWSGQEWELYIENLPADVEASQISSVLLHMTIVIDKILEKGTVEYLIVHTAILEYFTIADKTSASDAICQLIPLLTQGALIIDGDEPTNAPELPKKAKAKKKRSKEPLIVRIMQTREGLKLGISCLKYGSAKMIAKIVVVCNDAIIGHSEHQYVATGMPTKAALKLWSRKCISAKETVMEEASPETVEEPLLVSAIRGKKVERAPIWLMRQAESASRF